jgi:Protein of unknown function (DUF1475)
MKTFLKVFFGFIFVFMVTMTVRTSLQAGLLESLPAFAASPWSMATLYDAYAGFLTFFVWVAYKEDALWKKIAWLVAILALGNIAMSFYVLMQLSKLKADEPAWAILKKQAA